MNKIIFIDIDGTLILPDQTIPESAIEAIHKTQSLGNKVFIATGRSKSEITPTLRNVGFDGYIGAGGGYVEINNHMLYHEVMDPFEVKRIITFFNQHNIDYYVDTNHGTYSSKNCVATIRKMFIEHYNTKYKEPTDFFEILSEHDINKLDYHNVNKISFISNTLSYEQIHDEFNLNNSVIHYTVFEFGLNSGEIGPKSISKKTAIKFVKEHYNNEYTTYAYGNGNNDIPMFEAVDHAVAIKGSPQIVLDAANEIADYPENDGIIKSFQVNNLL